MKHVIGIDPSLTATAVVALRKNGVRCPQLFTSKPPGIKSMRTRIMRAQYLVGNIMEWVSEVDGVEMVIIEGYSFGSRQGSHYLGEYGGLLRASLIGMLACDRIVEAPPSSLKQFATGKGNANKLAVATALVKRYGCDFGGSDDLYDAFGLAKLAACVVGWDEPANEGHRKAVETIRAMEKTADIK